MVKKGYWKEYYWKNREALLKKRRDFAKANPEQIKKYQQGRDKAKDRIKSHDYYYSNLPKVRVYHLKRYLTNRERLLEQSKGYRKTSKGRIAGRRHSLNRMSLKKGAKYEINKEKFEKIVSKANGNCTYCKSPISLDTLSIDHVKPFLEELKVYA